MKYFLSLLFITSTCIGILYPQISFCNEELIKKDPPYPNSEENENTPPIADLDEPQKKQGKLIPKEGNDYRLIRHPFAKKGLKRITKKGLYLYQVETSSNSSSSSLKLGFTDIPNITSLSGDTTLTFTDVYGAGPINTFYGDYEWKNLISTFGLKVSAGLSISFGEGKVQDNSGNFVPSKEEFQLFIVPLDAGINWRWNFFKNQWLIPYVYGGIATIFLAENRDDKNLLDSNFAYSFAGVGAGGLMINISKIDPQSIFTLDRDYGINDMWLTAEYRIQQGLMPDLDFTTNSLNVGITVDF